MAGETSFCCSPSHRIDEDRSRLVYRLFSRYPRDLFAGERVSIEKAAELLPAIGDAIPTIIDG